MHFMIGKIYAKRLEKYSNNFEVYRIRKTSKRKEYSNSKDP